MLWDSDCTNWPMVLQKMWEPRIQRKSSKYFWFHLIFCQRVISHFNKNVYSVLLCFYFVIIFKPVYCRKPFNNIYVVCVSAMWIVPFKVRCSQTHWYRGMGPRGLRSIYTWSQVWECYINGAHCITTYTTREIQQGNGNFINSVLYIYIRFFYCDLYDILVLRYAIFAKILANRTELMQVPACSAINQVN